MPLRRRITFSSFRRWWSSVLGLPGRRSRAHLGADRYYCHGADAGWSHGGRSARHGPAAAGRALPRGTAGRHNTDPTACARRDREEQRQEQVHLRMTDLTALTLAEARERLRKKDITALELTDAHVGAVEAARALNAFVKETPEHARAMARASDARLAKGEGGLLEGIPLGIKDLFATQGVRTTAGS